ncbi:MAG: hypothetical protein ABH889_01005 [Candidatus Portnoybacteria bacterium]
MTKKINQKGFISFYITILVLAAFLGIGTSIFSLSLKEHKIIQNTARASRAYFAAEAGLEDALLKLNMDMNWSSPYTLNVDDLIATISISGLVGGTRIITAEVDAASHIKKVQVLYQITTEEISFHYGAQVGDGGMIMGNGSKVLGNVFSNGNVTGGGTITNSITVAGNGNKIQGINVGENATVHTCENANITGTLYYVSGGGIGSCTYDTAVDTGPNEIEPVSLPISLSQINDWELEAAAGEIITNDVVVNGIQSMGPVQIGTLAQPKNLTVGIDATLRLNGTIYVTGNIIFNNNSMIRLEDSYGSLSGIIIADGTIMISNGTQLNGSGFPGSYILILSTKNDTVNPVIDVRNNAAGAIFYTNSGLIYLKNNMKAREVTGYKIQLENNAEIQYETGLEDAMFSTGPGGSWEVTSWQEIE